MKFNSALIVGAGPGLGASLARLFAANDLNVTLAARSTDKLLDLCKETGANAVQCDASNETDVERLFKTMAEQNLLPDLVVYNASGYTRGEIAHLDLDAAHSVLQTTAFGALVVAQQAAKIMLEKRSGAMLFTGASAGVKGFARSAPFAMGKFALRGLCQSLARELAPSNIHVAHFVVDGCIYQPERGAPYDAPDTTLHPDEIAKSYFEVAKQDRSAWTWEMELRPFTEKF